MKISTLLFFALLMSSKAFSQLYKGQFLLGGSLRFESVQESYYQSGTYKGTNIFVSPAVGAFVLNKLAGGVRVDFSSYKSNSSNVEIEQTTMALSPFVRYYFLPVASKINVFLDAGYLHSKTKWNIDPNPAYTDKLKGFQVLAGPSGNNAQKIRSKIASKGKGKSGGARAISLVETVLIGEVVVKEEEITVNLLTIYDKADTANITDKELKDLIKIFYETEQHIA